MTETIVFLDMAAPERIDQIMRPLVPPGFTLTHAVAHGDAHLKEIIADADYAISGQVAVSGEVLRTAKKLKLLHKWGVGVDNIDLDTASRLGIMVARTAGANATAVAEFALGLMLSGLRGISWGHFELQRGNWRGGKIPGDMFTLYGKTVGIIGFGSIGQALAGLLKGFACTLLYNKRNALSAEEEAALAVRYASVQEVLSQSDVVALTCPLTSETRHMIDHQALSMMKKTAFLVNVARGDIVVEDDLIRALEDKQIAGAAIDVFKIEPLPSESPLLNSKGLITTPHLAAAVSDTAAETLKRIFSNIALVSRGISVPARDLVAAGQAS